MVTYISIARFAEALVSPVGTWGAVDLQPVLHSARSRKGRQSRKNAVSYGKMLREPTS
jgi:hypothetical protein